MPQENTVPEPFTLPKAYDPKQVEDQIYQQWLANGVFNAEVNPDRRPFCIVIPPPNVTGALHLGHALDNTMQDILIRFRRMQGYESLWMPGTDHAGIATQHVVEERLHKEGLSRYDLGREKFLERVWAWKDEYEARITHQLQKLGASCDWRRQRFTMDPGCSRAVRQVFVNLYKKGLIYRGEYIINWCPDCHTALSDIEVEHEPSPGLLYHIRYPLADGSGYIVIATARPETMLGDTGIAVNPNDARYQHLVGKTAILPLVGRTLPIVADELADPEFGTGALKITPAHDTDDFAMGRRHHLPAIKVINEEGRMTAEAGPFAGMERFAAREAVVEELRRQGYLDHTEEYEQPLGHCYRCHTVTEPMLSRQWFMRMEPLAKPAIEAVKSGQITIWPERFTKIYLNWMANIRDWCISRQIWWGHRIPAWYCRDCGHTTVAMDDPAVCEKCGSPHIEQDEDVLDTWFSSALWPFETLGWPDDTPELRYFYPTSVLVTGYDILFFWVARMIFSGIEHTGKIPFRDVLLHGLIRDAQGRKMSKSRGNGVDPLDVVDKYGADTLRFTLVTGNAPGNDIRFSWDRVESARNFANKLWNAARFVLANLGDFEPAAAAGFSPTNLADRWILSRYHSTTRAATQALESFELGQAAQSLYDFIWSEFCDWYIELSKPRLAAGGHDRRETQYVLWTVLQGILKLLHPFMPFITEQIWQHMPGTAGFVARAPWPEADPGLIDPAAEQDMSVMIALIRGIRSIRAEMNVAPGRTTPVILVPADDRARGLVSSHQAWLANLAMSSPIEVDGTASPPPDAATTVAPGVQAYVLLRGTIDVEKELARLRKEVAAAKEEHTRAAAKLAQPDFLAKAKAEVVAREKERAALAEEKLSRLQKRVELLERLR